MALFPRHDVLPEEEAARRRGVTQEVGTRRLVTGFLVLIAAWFISSRVWDAYLLRHTWPPEPPADQGLTVVSTLDRRGAYDRNLFQVVQSEGASRAELTNYGWGSIFSGQHGPLTDDRTGNLIQTAINLDSETGFAMLAPFLAAEIRFEMGDRHAYARISPDEPIDTTIPMSPSEKKVRHVPSRPKPLRELLRYFQTEASGGKNQDGNAIPEGGSGSEHQVEHGLAIPPEVLVHTCPVVLTTRHFSSGWVQEHPESVMGGKTYSVWLGLTPEGRSRFYQWSRNHVNEHLLLILDKSIVANGRIAMTMDVDTWEITNLKDGAAAHKLVDFINTNHRTAK